MTEAKIPTRKRIRVATSQLVTREFPVKSKAHVAVNETVTPETVIASYETSSGFHVLHLGKAFGSAKAMQKYLHKRVGDRIYAGEIIIEKPGFLPLQKHTVKSTVDGTIQSLSDNGDMTIRLHGNHIAQAALFWGSITAVNNFTETTPQPGDAAPKAAVAPLMSPSISLKTQYITLSGVMGSGRKREGRIAVICGASDFMLSANIDQSMQASIIIGGALIDQGFLAKAIKCGVAGIIAGGIHLRDATAMGMKAADSASLGTDIGISIMATEGFGPITINAAFYALLNRFQNRFAMLDGNEGTLTIPLKPDELQSLAFADNKIQQPQIVAKKGVKVRVVGGQGIGSVGEIVAVGKPEPLSSGFIVPLVSVLLANEKAEMISVPLTNLEAFV